MTARVPSRPVPFYEGDAWLTLQGKRTMTAYPINLPAGYKVYAYSTTGVSCAKVLPPVRLRAVHTDTAEGNRLNRPFPFGGVGTRWWVKEPAIWNKGRTKVLYLDDPNAWDAPEDNTIPFKQFTRQMSRVTVEVTDVIATKLHMVTEEQAEQITCYPAFECDVTEFIGGAPIPNSSYLIALKQQWNSRQPPKLAYDKNPWIWLYTYRLVR